MNITYDIHCHTHLSVCGQQSATIEYYVASAKKLGLDTVGIADHMWDNKVPFHDDMYESLFAQKNRMFVANWYKVQDMDHCRQILKEIEQTDTQGIRFLFGGEVEYCPGVGLAISEEEAAQLDFIVVPNSHTHHLMHHSLYEPYEKHGQYMLNAAMEICTSPLNKYVTSLAHPFEAVECPYPVEYIIDTITDAQLGEVFSAAKEAGIAAEINGGVYREMRDEQIRNHYMLRILGIAKKCGCKFTFGSDSHEAGGQDTILYAAKAAEYLGLTDDDILKI